MHYVLGIFGVLGRRLQQGLYILARSDAPASARDRWTASRSQHLEEFWFSVISSAPQFNGDFNKAGTGQGGLAVAPSRRLTVKFACCSLCRRLNVRSVCVSLIKLLFLPVVIPTIFATLLLPSAALSSKYYVLCEVYYIMITTSVFAYFGNAVVLACLDESCRKTQLLLGQAVIVTIMSLSRYFCFLLYYVYCAGYLMSLLTAYVCMSLQLAVMQKYRLAAWMFLLFGLGGMVPATGLGLYMAMWYYDLGQSTSLTMLAAITWAMLPYAPKAIVIKIRDHAMPADKGVGGALFGFYIDTVVGVLGLPIFVRSPIHLVMYMLTLVLVLLVQFMRGLPCIFGSTPSCLRASKALHLHQMVVFLEGFGGMLGRAVAFATYLGSKAFLLARFNSRLDRESTKASSMTNLYFHSSIELNLGGDSILLALVGLTVCFLAHFVFCKLVDRCWWHSARSAVVHASREEEPTDNCSACEETGRERPGNSSSSSVPEPHVLGQAMAARSNDDDSGGAIAQPELLARRPALLCGGFATAKLLMESYISQKWHYMSAVSAFCYVMPHTLVFFSASLQYDLAC